MIANDVGIHDSSDTDAGSMLRLRGVRHPLSGGVRIGSDWEPSGRGSAPT